MGRTIYVYSLTRFDSIRLIIRDNLILNRRPISWLNS
jgi:hypothetical protein